MGNYSNDANGSFAKSSRNAIEKISVNPARIFRILMSRWYWILGSVVICLCIAFIYAKSTKERFLSESILKFDSKSNEAKFSTKSIMSGATSESSDYMAEVYRVKSTAVLDKALDSLGADFFFYEKRGLREVNLYPHRPFEADVLHYDIEKYPGGIFKLTRNNNKYDLRFVNDKAKINILFSDIKEGSAIKVQGLSFRLKTNVLTEFKKINFSYIDYWMKRSMSDQIVIKEAERNLPVLRATFSSDNGMFTRDFLSAVISSYCSFDVETKKRSSEQSLSFINEQLTAFEGLMRQSSSKLENIKSRYELLDVSATSNQYMSSVADLRTRKLNLEIQGKNFDLVTEDIKNNKEVVANVIGWDGAPDPFLNRMLQELNDAYRARKQNLINYSPQSIVVKNLDDEIDQLKRKIIENINLQRRKSEQAYSAYDKQLMDLNKDLSKMPSAERDLIYTTSDVDVNKNIYTLLLNKKLETNIDMAGQTPAFTTIERPEVSVRTSTSDLLIMLLGGLVGLIIGILAVFLKRLFNARFTDVGIIEKKQNVSLIGVVRHTKGLKNAALHDLLTLQAEDDVLTEDLNSIRTNVLFSLGDQANKIISVTSGRAADGKSFIVTNLALALTKLGKKVIVVEADLRRPKLHLYFGQDNRIGLRDFLEENIDLSKVIRTSALPGLDIISSGQAVRDPSGLLHTDKFITMLEELRNRYDYVLVDTAPVGIVTDGIPALRASDVNIFVLRWRHSPRETAEMPYALAASYDLKMVGVVVNDFRDDALYSSLEDSSGTYSSLYFGDLYTSGSGKMSMRHRLFGSKTNR